MQQNNVSITITPAEETAILTKIDELRVLLEAFSISLNDEQRATWFKLGDARLAFDLKCSDLHAPAPRPRPAGHQHHRVRQGWRRPGDADLTFYNYLSFAARTGATGADDASCWLPPTILPPAPIRPPATFARSQRSARRSG